jgi:hypothetical protein
MVKHACGRMVVGVQRGEANLLAVEEKELAELLRKKLPEAPVVALLRSGTVSRSPCMNHARLLIPSSLTISRFSSSCT